MGSTAEFKPLAETIMFKGLQLGALKLEHRVVQSPTTRMRGTKVAEGVWEVSDLAGMSINFQISFTLLT